MLRDNKIMCFLTLAETLNYTKAAKQLFMSQQAVSRCIAALEDELQALLFVRTTRSVELTPIGRMYYDLFYDLRKEFNERLEIIKREADSGNYKKIFLGVQSYLDVTSIIHAISDLRNIEPELNIEVVRYSPPLLMEHFLNNRLDIILILNRFLQKDIGLNKEELLSIPLVLMVSSNNPLATEDATFETFLNMPFISDLLEGEDNLTHRMRAQHDIKLWGLSPENIIWASDRDSAYTYAELDYGIVIGIEMSCIARNRNLKMYKTGKLESLWLIRRENCDNPMIELFIKILKKHYRNYQEKLARPYKRLANTSTLNDLGKLAQG